MMSISELFWRCSVSLDHGSGLILRIPLGKCAPSAHTQNRKISIGGHYLASFGNFAIAQSHFRSTLTEGHPFSLGQLTAAVPRSSATGP
jgi:hypothetical protein